MTLLKQTAVDESRKKTKIVPLIFCGWGKVSQFLTNRSYVKVIISQKSAAFNLFLNGVVQKRNPLIIFYSIGTTEMNINYTILFFNN